MYVLFHVHDYMITWNTSCNLAYLAYSHTGDFPRGVGHRVENRWGLTKVAVVLLNDLIW